MRRDTFGLVFSNAGEALIREMTEERCFASLPFGGRYRMIDFVLSNMVHAGISKVGIITTTNYRSLMDHLGSGKPWDMARKKGGIVIFPPYITNGIVPRYNRVTELYGILRYLSLSEEEYVFCTDCDVVCNLDLDDIARYHIEKEADITLVYRRGPLPRNQDNRMVFHCGPSGRVSEILISPQTGTEHDVCLNMAFVKKSLLISLIQDAVSRNYNSIGRDILQRGLSDLRIYGYRLEGYSAVIDGMQGYLEASMALLDRRVRKELFLPDRPIYTKVRDEMPAKYGLGSTVKNSLIADGCVIEGRVENSILFRGVRVGKGSLVRNCVVMQGSEIGENANIAYVIADKDVSVLPGRVLVGYETYPAYVSKGTAV